MPSSTGVKSRIADLALFGGTPLFESPVCVGKPNLPDPERFLSLARASLERNWLTNDGPNVRHFEGMLAAQLDTKHVVAVANATLGLELTFRALGLKGTVLMPSFTFVASAHAALSAGLNVRFVDIDPQTHNLDPEAVASAVTPDVCAILGVHVWGRPCVVERLEWIALQNNLKLVFDAAHAFGCSVGGVPLGNFGNAEVFSFHATKFINSVEGGAIATNDDELADRLRQMRNFGFVGLDDVRGFGTNAKMSEIHAAMGLANLTHCAELVAHNEGVFELYRQGLEGTTFALAEMNSRCTPNYQYVPVEVSEDSSLCRNVVIDVLRSEGIQARRYFFPGCHQMEPYRSLGAWTLPSTERLCERVLCLPSGLQVDAEQVEAIVGVLRLLSEKGHEVQQRTSSIAA
jgi:dTDP-4-amino-4,6-dideoxygalactose transaminase